MENALAEVYDIIMHSEKTILEKIPISFINFIKDNKNNDYEVKINYSENINKQKCFRRNKSNYCFNL